MNETMKFNIKKDNSKEVREILELVYSSLEEKGYNSISQLTGYMLSGDPAYVTSYNGARTAIRKLERDELLEEIIRFYLEKKIEE